jgi:hypothetical protein
MAKLNTSSRKTMGFCGATARKYTYLPGGVSCTPIGQFSPSGQSRALGELHGWGNASTTLDSGLRLRAAALGDFSGAYGAAWVALKKSLED